jgi:hypothetical protein
MEKTQILNSCIGMLQENKQLSSWLSSHSAGIPSWTQNGKTLQN